MAEHLNTEPVLVVIRETSQTDSGLTPLPVDASGIPNDHFEYAVTWFLLAFVWAIMSLYLLLRTTRQKDTQD
jgi:surfeit locus 1 family protein